MVEANLPSGVIRNNTEAVSGDIEKIDNLTVEELAKLWRAYSTKQKLLANDVGRRLENFFWRIWSSERVRTTIRGTQIAIIFEDISQGHIIRTTPTSSPRNSRLYTVAQRAQEAIQRSPERGRSQRHGLSSQPLQQRPQPQQTPSTETIVPRKNSEAGEFERERERERERPPPILKKPGADYGTSNKTARIQTPGWKSGALDPDHDEPMSPAEVQAQRQALSPRFQDQELEGELLLEDGEMSPATVVSVEADMPSSATSQFTSTKMVRNGSGQGSSSGLQRSKKKGSFVVASARSRRPIMGRRQSSQAAGGNSNKMTSPALRPTRRKPDDAGTSSTTASSEPSRSNSVAMIPALELCASRSHSPVSESPFRRTARDHVALDKAMSPDNVHREAAGLLAPRSQWISSLGDAQVESTDMRRTSSASGSAMRAIMAKSRPASMSSSNLQAAGTMTPTETSSATPVRQSMFGRATSFMKGKNKATFDIGPPETDSAAASRRTSVEINPEFQAAGSVSGFSHSRSQSQLSGLLDQVRKKEAQNRSRYPDDQTDRKSSR